jgi:D-glycero-alpha-D-manno-heptose-7-phosphate kinase
LSRAAVSASAPTRIDLAGGTLDIWPLSILVPRAVTVNLAVELRAMATIEPRGDGRVRVVSRDRGTEVTCRLPLRQADLRGPLAVPLRIVEAFRPRRGLELTCLATAPAGAGLGGSSSLGIAIGAALGRFTGAELGRQALLRRVMNLETMELRVPTGNQDYLAALYGGLAAYEHGPDGVRRRRIPLPRGLAARLVLAYTGEPRHSGLSNWDMFRRYLDGERTTVRRLEAIARVAQSMAEALAEDDLDEAGRLLGEEGRLRYELAPTVSTPMLRRVGHRALGAGALGVKVCGAGGGGCLVAFARAGRAAAVAEAMTRARARVLRAPAARRGLRISGT